MVKTKRVFTAASLSGDAGAGWLVIPDSVARYRGMNPNKVLEYTGIRYDAVLSPESGHLLPEAGKLNGP